MIATDGLDAQENIEEDSLELLEAEESEGAIPSLGCGDFVDGKLWYCFRKGSKTFLVNSAQELYHSSDKELLEWSKGFRVNHVAVPDFNSWSNSSIASFVKSTCDDVPDLEEIGDSLRDILRKAIYIQDEAVYDLLVCWIISSYVYNLFPAAASIHLQATAGSGKTSLANLLLKLSFQGASADGRTALYGKISQAALWVSQDRQRGTCVIDDSEIIGNPAPTPLRQGMLTSAYKKSANQTLIQRGQPRSYNLYGQKIYTSIGDCESTLATRLINIQLSKAPEGFSPVEPDEDVLQKLRDGLHIWSMKESNLKALIQSHEVEKKDVRYKERWADITLPLRTVASLCALSDSVHSVLERRRNVAATSAKNHHEALSKTIVKLIHEGYEGMSIPHLYCELQGLKRDISAAVLGRLAMSSRLLKPDGRVEIAGVKVAVYKPSRVGFNLARASAVTQEKAARDFCPQGSFKQWKNSGCDECPYKSHCPIRTKNLAK